LADVGVETSDERSFTRAFEIQASIRVIVEIRIKTEHVEMPSQDTKVPKPKESPATISGMTASNFDS